MGQLLLFVEYAPGAGWHSHGIGWLPEGDVGMVMSFGQEWLAGVKSRYKGSQPEWRTPDYPDRVPSAVIGQTVTDEEVEKCVRYATKWWNSQGKAGRIILSGRSAHSLRA